MKNPALILFSHGSLLCGSGSMLKRHADRLRATGRYLLVESGYLNYCDPPIEDAINKCAAAGASHVVVVPYFLVSGKFVTEDLPARLKQAALQHPDVKFTMAQPLEDAEPMMAAIEEVLATAVAPDRWQARAIRNAQAVCQMREDCPLYGSPMCRKDSKP